MKNVFLFLLLLASVCALAIRQGDAGGGGGVGGGSTCTAQVWFRDADNDGYYVTGSRIVNCYSPGAGYKTSGLIGAGDCNDNDATIHPNAEEIPNDGKDNNCNGVVDETIVFYTYYTDNDGDGLGNPYSTTEEESATPPEGFVTNAMDCNDDDPTNNHILYVDSRVGTGGDGSSWMNAYSDLTEAIANRTSCITEIWVARGTYYTASTNGRRTASFRLQNELAIYGGLAGNEAPNFDLNQRDFVQNQTILSGDFDQDGILNAGNSYHVVTGYNLNSTAIMDGFTITGGNADYDEFLNDQQERGGGAFLLNSTPMFFNCAFKNNSAKNTGGAIYNENSSTQLFNCSMYGNTAPTGAGITNANGSPIITNCSIANNAGSALDNASASASPNISNSIIWGNTTAFSGNQTNITVSYSTVQGGFAGTNNLAGNPLFANAANGNLRLTPGSPAIDAGLNSNNVTPADLDGHARIFNTTIDMGAYESQSICPTGNILYVNAAAAAGGDGSSWATAYNTLQDALANACPGVQFIWVTVGTYYPDEGGGKTNNDRNAAFAMKDNIGIVGGFSGTETSPDQRNPYAGSTYLSGDIDKNGILDDGNSYHVIFNNNNGLGAGAWIDRCIITGGNANGSGSAGNGGGLCNINCFPAFFNCVFEKNSATRGGGVFNSGSQTQFQRCVFVENNASIDGGGMYNTSNANVILKICEFDDNTAQYGGGMYNVNCTPAITETYFVRNKAAIRGGAILNLNSSATTSHCEFTGNQATYEGGAMHNENHANGNISDCKFTNNTGNSGAGVFNWNCTPTFTQCKFTGNQAGFEAGGMLNYQSANATINNCEFTNNSSQYGGGVLNRSSSTAFINCKFAGNQASIEGGAMHNYENAVTNITNGSFANNSATSMGGGIRNKSSNAVLTNCIVWGNINGQISDDANSQTTVSYSVVQDGFTGTGNYDVDPKFVNAATGDLHLQPGAPPVNKGLNSANTLSTDLDGNTRIIGGTIDMGAYESQVICPAGNILYVNAAAAPGGNGSSWATAYKTLQDALANACVNVTQIWVAKGTYYPTTTSDRSISFVMKPGIAIYGGFDGTEQANYNLTQRNFAANPTILSGDLLHNDEPGLTGAALYNDASRADNSYHVINNNNNGLGASAILDGFTITNGNGNGSGFPYNTGGGMLNWASAPIITNCSFVKNSAQSGGGLYVLNGALAANMAITHCSFQDNYSNGPIGSNLGGGGAEIRAHTSFSILFSDCSFTNNSSAGFGGGLFLPVGSVEITGCSFTNNTAYQGGGLFVLGSTVTANNCRFLNNTASDKGGGLYGLGGSDFCSYTNCIFAKNKSGGRGAAIYTDYNADVVNNFTNCTIVNNVALNGSGGIVVTNEGTNIQLNISNTILWGNRGSIADQFLNDPDYPVPTTISNSLVQGGYTGGTAIIDLDPLLVDTAAGNLHLQACSPAINAGTATGAPATDLDGNTRPALDDYDMGAYEFTGSLPVALVLNCPPAAKVFACGLPGISTTTGLAYSTTATNITAADLVAAGGSITPGGCAVSAISYQDAIDATNSTAGKTVVNRTFTVTDIGSKTYTCTQVITVQDYTIDATASSKPVAVGTTAILSATVSPAEAGVPVTFYLDDVSKGTSLTGSDGVATLDVSGLLVDVYQVKATVGDCVEGNAIFSVYNPDGGFVTGAGWINSPKAALVASPLITGKANFGLNAKYQKGKNIVDGDTEFKFKAGDFNFKSLNNDAGSLVISGGKATYRGTGTVNDAGDYGFMVVAIDGAVNGTDPTDKFRIKIWDRSQGNTVVYDNQLGKSEFGDDATELGGGAIVIQTPKVKKATITLQPAATNNDADLAIQVSNNPSAQGQPFRLQVTSTDKTTPVAVTVLDVSGRPVQSWKNQQAGAVLEAGSLWTKGMYIVEAVQDNKRVQVKLLKL